MIIENAKKQESWIERANIKIKILEVTRILKKAARLVLTVARILQAVIHNFRFV